MSFSIPHVAKINRDFVTSKLELFERQLNPASQEDVEAVRRAIFSVRNKAVLFERYNETTNKLFTVIQDVRPAEVTVDFYKKTTTCTCPQAMCRHQLAVLLGLYQYIGSVQDWRAQWMEKQSFQLHSLATERTPEAWIQMVDGVMDHLLPTGRRVESYLVTSFLENAHAKLRRYMPLEREWQPIYKLFVELAVMNKIWSHFLATDSPLQSDYFSSAMERRFQLMVPVIEELSTSRLFATDPFYDAIQQELLKLALHEAGATHVRMDFYFSCWQRLLLDKKRAQVEIAALQGDVLTIVPAIVAKDEQLIAKQIGLIDGDYLAFYEGVARFAFAIDAKYYAEQILRAMLPLLKYFIQMQVKAQYRQLFIHNIHALYEQIELTEAEELQLFAAFGRYGVQPYSDYLLKHERYEEWVALHQLHKSSIPYLEAIGLKDVMAAQPAVTLPLYHAYALEEVAQKSRMNYKQAARIWKQMRTAAKKAGKTGYFNDYIEQVRAQYKRLRALQEELDKANLKGEA